MEPQEIEKWEKVRQKGIVRYILKYGVFIALGYAYLGWFSLTSPKTTGAEIVGIAITSLLGGVVISLLFWYGKEIPYQHIKQKQHSN